MGTRTSEAALARLLTECLREALSARLTPAPMGHALPWDTRLGPALGLSYSHRGHSDRTPASQPSRFHAKRKLENMLFTCRRTSWQGPGPQESPRARLTAGQQDPGPRAQHSLAPVPAWL